MKRLSALLVFLVASACAGRGEPTTYVTRIDATTLRITGIAFADDQELRSALLLRAAQETLRYGRPSFLVFDQTASAKSERFWTIDRPSLGGFVFDYGPEELLIRILSAPKGVNSPLNVFDAAEIVRIRGAPSAAVR